VIPVLLLMLFAQKEQHIQVTGNPPRFSTVLTLDAKKHAELKLPVQMSLSAVVPTCYAASEKVKAKVTPELLIISSPNGKKGDKVPVMCAYPEDTKFK